MWEYSALIVHTWFDNYHCLMDSNEYMSIMSERFNMSSTAVYLAFNTPTQFLLCDKQLTQLGTSMCISHLSVFIWQSALVKKKGIVCDGNYQYLK